MSNIHTQRQSQTFLILIYSEVYGDYKRTWPAWEETREMEAGPPRPFIDGKAALITLKLPNRFTSSINLTYSILCFSSSFPSWLVNGFENGVVIANVATSTPVASLTDRLASASLETERLASDAAWSTGDEDVAGLDRDLDGSRTYDQSQDGEKRYDEESEDKEERRNGRHV